MVRKENIEKGLVGTSFIPNGTVNSEHTSTIGIAHEIQQEQIYFVLIILEITNTLKRANHLANSNFLTPPA